MDQKINFQDIYDSTKDVYNRKGREYDTERSKTLFERGPLERFESLLPEKADILDVGCGAGEPIARYFIERGHGLVGIDYSETLIDLAKQRFPNSRWYLSDMRSLKIDETFDGLIAWHSFFHLKPEDQRHTLKLFVEHLKPGGALMVTIGVSAGEVIGNAGGEKVYHSSLGINEYQEILKDFGMAIVDFADYGYATVILAQKKR